MQFVSSLVVLAAAAASMVCVHAEAQLKQVLVLSRHGIRGPYGLGTSEATPSIIDQYVRNPAIKIPYKAKDWGITDDEDEIVSPKITRHGYSLVQKMGTYFGQELYRDFLGGQCEKIISYMDNNQRDNETSRAFMSGMVPDCHDLVNVTKQTRLLFEQGQDPTADCPVCSRAVYEGIVGASDTRYYIEEHRHLIQEMNDLLQCCGPIVCSNSTAKAASQKPLHANGDRKQPTASPRVTSKTCDLFGFQSYWNGAFFMPWMDTFSHAQYFSEWFLMMALNNMPLPAGLTLEKVLEFADLHEAFMDMITNEVNSANFGATLLAHMTASMHQNVGNNKIQVAEGEGPQLVQDHSNKFIYYAGHDINILYIKNLLRMQWHSEGWYPHQSVLGGMILFELYHDDAMTQSNGWYVKAYFMSASPTQMREEQDLTNDNPPERIDVTIPDCSEEFKLENGDSDVRCTFDQFASLVGRIVKRECVAETMRPYTKSLTFFGEYFRDLFN